MRLKSKLSFIANSIAAVLLHFPCFLTRLSTVSLCSDVASYWALGHMPPQVLWKKLTVAKISKIIKEKHCTTFSSISPETR